MNNLTQDQNQGQANNQTPAGSPNQGAYQRYGRRGQFLKGERGQTSFIGGAFLVILGTLFLGQTLGGFYLNNWWALFILLPATGAFSNAWRFTQDAGGRMTGSARGSLVIGIVLVCVSAVFLFNLSWAIFGPALIILAGVVILLGGFLPK